MKADSTAQPVDFDLSPLFEPFRIKSMTLTSRIVMPAMQRHWCVDGAPPERLAAYYARRAASGTALVISESCGVDHPTTTQNPLFARISRSTQASWKRCIDAVHDAGGNMFLQLWHEGAVREEGDLGPYGAYPTLSPSGLVSAGRTNGRAATIDELDEIKMAFVRGATMAREIGADGVELHACHGYLLDQFLWSETNRRVDRYGGDHILGRARFPAEIAAAIRAATDQEFVISIRISQWKEIDYNARIVETPTELELLISELRSAGVDVFHVSARRFWTPEWAGSDLGFAGWVKSFTDAPVIAVGSVGLDIDVMENLREREAQSTGSAGFDELMRRFNRGDFDLLSVGRSQIADPEWFRKIRAGDFASVRAFKRADTSRSDDFDV